MAAAFRGSRLQQMPVYINRLEIFHLHKISTKLHKTKRHIGFIFLAVSISSD